MESYQKIIGILLLGLLGLGGILWQWRVIARGRKGIRRVKWAFIISGVLLLGILVRGLIAWQVDAKADYELKDLLSDMGGTALFCALFVAKSYFGPVLVAASLALVGYYFIEYGELGLYPVLGSVVDWVLSFAPAAVQNIYLVFFGVYAFGTSLLDTFDFGV